jgi:hypothetical protein
MFLRCRLRLRYRVVPDVTLTNRALNRATLARQMLIAREPAAVGTAVARLAGMQAQLARPPFIGLWTRLTAFDRRDLIADLLARRVVRVPAMRATLHLMTADHYAAYRSALQPALDRALSWISKRLTDADRRVVEPAGREFFATAAPFDALRKSLAEKYPKADHRALAYAIRLAVPLVQVPTETDAWGFPAAASFVLADRWLKKKLRPRPDTAGLIRTYLGAFGPASAADMRAWSGLPDITAEVDAVRPSLVTFRDARGRELFDLPDAPRPPADTPAPVRFLPDYDNLLLAHADRSRIIAAEHRPRVTSANLQIAATFLIDGVVAGSWKIERTARRAELRIEPFVSVSKTHRAELEDEGTRLLRFVEPGAAPDVRLMR